MQLLVWLGVASVLSPYLSLGVLQALKLNAAASAHFPLLQ